VTGYSGTVHFASSDGSAILPANSTLTNGARTFSATLNTSGNQTLTATDTVTPSITGTSGAVNAAVNSTTTSLAPSAATVTYGAAQTFTATVTAGASPVTTGAVTFTDTTTSTVLAANVALNAGGQAIRTFTLAAGPHVIQSTYNGAGVYSSSSNTASVTVNKAVLTVTANDAIISTGSPLPAFSATITGFVNGDTAAALSGSPSFSTTATAAPPAGSYVITPSAGTLAAANYSFAFVNGRLLVTQPAGIVTNFGGTSSAGAGVYLGQAFTTPSGGPRTNITFSFFSDQGVTPQASGTAYVFASAYDGTPAGLSANGASSALALSRFTARAAIDGAQGAVLIATSSNVVGNAYIFEPSLVLQPNTQYFVYEDAPLTGVASGSSLPGGNGYIATLPSTVFTAMSTSLNFRVTGSVVPPPRPVSIVHLSSTLNPSQLGQAVSFTAIVEGSDTVPAGSIQFMDGSALLGTATLAGGRAVFSTSALTAGQHLIIAMYSGGGAYPPAEATLFQRVNPLAPTLAATANPAAAVYGQAVVLNATVGPTSAPAGFALPTGQVSFGLEGSNPFSQPTPLGTVALASGAASLSIGNFTLGEHRIQVRYSGDTTWGGAIAEILLTVSPAQSAATVSMTVAGGKPLLISTVSAGAPGAGIPTGTVRFVDTSTSAVVANATLSGGTAD